LYELPYVHSHGNPAMYVLNAITSGWQSSGTITFSTGAPETIIDNQDINQDGFNNDRPSLGNPKVPINYTSCFDASATCNSGVGFSFDGVTFADFNSSFGVDPKNPNNFTATKNDFHYYMVLGQNGDLGRNTYTSPGFQFWNLSAQKTIKFKERYNFILRGEFYNAFNHPNLGIPNLKLTSSNFGNTLRTINGGRIVVLWGKFSF
jgi:hypothetical protein